MDKRVIDKRSANMCQTQRTALPPLERTARQMCKRARPFLYRRHRQQMDEWR